ncbi:MFS transporter [Marinobacter salicampi]|uniref:MFS transporter n=1 Tax=Marinobacter salicampi TaxID=435907 RepID=UPI00140BBD34|nr:MFS transporter [Marinobacter salicampi]
MNNSEPIAGPDTDAPLSVVLPLAFVAVFMAFACWTLLAVMGVHMKQMLALSSTSFGLLLATPILSGGLLAVPMGFLIEARGGRQVILGCLAGLSLVLVILMLVKSYLGLLFVATGLGLSGGLFISGLHYVVGHSATHRMGVAMGCCGAGVIGAGFSYLAVPLIHEAFRWQVAPMAYILILGITMALIYLLTDPEGLADMNKAESSEPGSDLWPGLLGSFCLSYSVLFGGFVALALWLPDYLSAQHELSLKKAAGLAILFIVPGALAQIPGGWLADRLGPQRIIRWTLLVCLGLLLVLSYPPMDLAVTGVEQVYLVEFRLPVSAVVAMLMLLSTAMGLGLGGLLRQLYDFFPRHIGIAAGFMLLAACLLTFALPLLFGLGNDLVGIRSIAFMLLFVVTGMALVVSECTARSEERRVLLARCRARKLSSAHAPVAQPAMPEDDIRLI